MSNPLTLYRPVGLKEAELILDSGCSAFPPRLPDQPIFYPVMNAEYARQIARDWNTPDAGSGYAGFVTAFGVDADYASRFPVRTVGNSLHQELWVPAEDLATFNQHIQGPVRFTEAWYGPEYRGPATSLGSLERQFLALFEQGRDTLPLLQANTAACLFNAAWWSSTQPAAQGLDPSNHRALLDRLRQSWVALHPTWPLPAPGRNPRTGPQ
ncbi:hypothetical protein [Corallococcus macrosporus]|uniref:ADP-ribosylation/crystallin J1 n=1 Tax=Myxococcus fulvus (strain ATCC BAA-855 / HW-1) TaxID=483219 RepID=F8C919_MYXFH|nr:hypothetical protein [Corallococcus macrosporus]AEI64519.1 hypothetical protein LILAB_13060 [Corallococcus macrosporus]